MSVVQPLSRYRIWSLDQPDEIRGRLSEMYHDTAVTIEPATTAGYLKHEMYAVPLGNIVLNSMHFPFGVKATAPGLADNVDFCSTPQGVGRAKIGAQPFHFDQHRIVVLSPYEGFEFQAGENFTSLNVSVPRHLLEAQLRWLTGCESVESLRFDPVVELSSVAVASVWRFVEFAALELEQESSAFSNPVVIEQFGEALLTGLLYAQPHNFSHLLSRRDFGQQPRYVRQVEEYIHAYCRKPIKAQDLAAVTGISLSALYSGFRIHRGYSPMQFLKKVRLDRIRNELLVASPETKIKEVATRWGFTHLGRFSAAYQKQFGELPSDTLRRST